VALTGTTADGVARAEQALARFGPVTGSVCDVRDAASVAVAVRTAATKFGGLDVLVNSAGIGVGAPIAELPNDDWHRIIGTNLTGVFYACREAIPRLRSRGGGWIINIGSLAGKNPFAGGAAYNASKFGLLGFSEAMMLDVREHGIRVCCVMPGSVDTYFNGKEPRPENAWMIQPEDIARLVMELLAFPENALPSRIEIRPTRPNKR
ncbi:MAG TPA: SDR family oxidoreductase, partial [Longimicrobium sp.]|nr:SDR family oxidoreductase [Longimicrobium sp.]